MKPLSVKEKWEEKGVELYKRRTNKTRGGKQTDKLGQVHRLEGEELFPKIKLK